MRVKNLPPPEPFRADRLGPDRLDWLELTHGSYEWDEVEPVQGKYTLVGNGLAASPTADREYVFLNVWRKEYDWVERKKPLRRKDLGQIDLTPEEARSLRDWLTTWLTEHEQLERG